MARTTSAASKSTTKKASTAKSTTKKATTTKKVTAAKKPAATAAAKKPAATKAVAAKKPATKKATTAKKPTATKAAAAKKTTTAKKATAAKKPATKKAATTKKATTTKVATTKASTAKKTASKAPAKKASTKTTTAKKAAPKKTTTTKTAAAKKATTKAKTTAAKATTKKAPATKAPVKKATAKATTKTATKKAPAKKTPATKTTTAKARAKAPAKKTTAAKTTASKSSSAKKSSSKTTSSKKSAKPRRGTGSHSESPATLASVGKQKLKLIYLLKILASKTDANQGLSMPQLIEALKEEGISAERKSLYNDIQILRDAGYDIDVLSTRPPQYAYRRSELGFDEVMMLVDAVQSSRFLTESKSKQLVKSLKSLVSDQEKHKLDTRVHVHNRVKNQSESVFHSVDKIHEAMHDKKKIEFLYFGYDTSLDRKSRHDGKRYVVTPVRVVYVDSNYYLAAYDAQEKKVKIYRIDRMELLQKSSQDADTNLQISDYKLDDFDYQVFGMFKGDCVKVLLHVNADLMDAVVDEFGLQIVVKKSTTQAADVEVKVQVSPQFFGWVAGLDGDVTIKAPKKVADDYQDWLKALVKKNQS